MNRSPETADHARVLADGEHPPRLDAGDVFVLRWEGAGPAPTALMLAADELRRWTELARKKHPPNTIKAWAYDWAGFSAFCARRQLAPLPASAQLVAEFIDDRAQLGYALKSLKHYRETIAKAHIAAGLDNPCESQTVRSALKAADGVNGGHQKRAPEIGGGEVARVVIHKRLPRAGAIKTLPALSSDATLTHVLRFDGRVLQRGFWIYVCEVGLPSKQTVLLFGRTGGSPTINTESPFRRVGQLLGITSNKNSHCLRRWLVSQLIAPEDCNFQLISIGPIFDEVRDDVEYHRRLVVVASIQCALEREMRHAGYSILNKVSKSKSPPTALYEKIHAALAQHYPLLTK